MDRRAFLAAAAVLGLTGCQSLEAQGLKVEPPPPARDPDVPFVPTRQDVVEAMLKMAGVKAGDVVYDLGCGDGRIVITAAQKFGARGVGIDINPTRISEARYNAARAGVEKQVEFRVGDLFEADIAAATVVTLYLLPEVNLRLKPKLQRDLKPGTRIVSHDFSMGDDWKPERVQKVGNSTIYFWTIR
jgi:ubiquinone/menaquinone biosynthesis C-methylase UbiE